MLHTTHIQENKQCTKCNQTLSIDLFKVKNRRRTDGSPYKQIQSVCKSCWNKHYSGKRRIRNTSTTRTKIGYLARNRNYIRDYLSNSRCKDCGHGDWRVLEFDHLPEYEKHKNVCEMMNCSIKKIQNEIDKCEVVCSNCHSLRSFKRGNSWRML